MIPPICHPHTTNSNSQFTSSLVASTRRCMHLARSPILSTGLCRPSGAISMNARPSILCPAAKWDMQTGFHCFPYEGASSICIGTSVLSNITKSIFHFRWHWYCKHCTTLKKHPLFIYLFIYLYILLVLQYRFAIFTCEFTRKEMQGAYSAPYHR